MSAMQFDPAPALSEKLQELEDDALLRELVNSGRTYALIKADEGDAFTKTRTAEINLIALQKEAARRGLDIDPGKSRMRTCLILNRYQLILDAMSELLGNAGWTVYHSSSGTEAVEMARQFSPQVIISSFRLSDMDGLYILSELERDEQTTRIPFVFFSVNMSGSTREKLFKDRADAVIRNEDSAEILFEALQRLVPQEMWTE